MSRRRTWLKLGLGFGVALVVAGGALSLVKKSVPPPAAEGTAFQLRDGATLPDFEFQSLSGEAHRFQKWSRDQGAKIVVLNFWATWCEACVEEMPSLLKLVKRFPKGSVALLPINVDEEPTRAAPATVSARHWAFPSIYIDRDQKLGDLFDIQGIPLTVIARATGEVLSVDSGGEDWDTVEMREQLSGWLKQ